MKSYLFMKNVLDKYVLLINTSVIVVDELDEQQLRNDYYVEFIVLYK